MNALDDSLDALMRNISFIAVLLAVLCALGCHGRGGNERFGPVERLNAEPGTLGVFTFPYYSSIVALENGGAVAVFLRQENEARPLVYRRAADSSAAFGDEQVLAPDSLRDTISIIPDVRAGASKDELYATWQARRNATGDKFVIFRRSTDGGASWTPEHLINSERTSFIPSIATDRDGGVYAAWVDERKRGFRLFFNRSLDHGETWLPQDVSLDESDAKYGRVISVDIATDGKRGLVVVWEEDSGGGRHVHAISSGDGGTTWSEPVMVDDGALRPSPSAPRVVFAGGRAVVAWVASSSGTGMRSKLWADASSDGGRTWGTDVLISDVDAGVPPRFHLTAFDGTARLVFHAGPYAGPWHIYYDEMDGSGAWRTGDQVALVTDPAATESFSNPRLARDGDGTLFVTYERHQKSVHLSRSADGGASWQATSTPVYTVADETSGDAVHFPQVAVADGTVYVTWDVWASAKDVKTLAEANKPARADLFVRRIGFPRH